MDILDETICANYKTHTIRGTTIFTYMLMADFDGFHVGIQIYHTWMIWEKQDSPLLSDECVKKRELELEPLTSNGEITNSHRGSLLPDYL